MIEEYPTSCLGYFFLYSVTQDLEDTRLTDQIQIPKLGTLAVVTAMLLGKAMETTRILLTTASAARQMTTALLKVVRMALAKAAATAVKVM